MEKLMSLNCNIIITHTGTLACCHQLPNEGVEFLQGLVLPHTSFDTDNGFSRDAVWANSVLQVDPCPKAFPKLRAPNSLD